jgi:hypothetical protein
MLSELDRRQVVEARMQSKSIVVPTPDLDDDLRLATTAGPLQAQTLVAKDTMRAAPGLAPLS